VTKKKYFVTSGKIEGQQSTLVFTGQTPLVQCVGDSITPGGIFRIENCGLMELTDMLNEVLEGSSLKSGTVVLMGSVWYLHTVP
jgi:hypothetical protein